MNESQNGIAGRVLTDQELRSRRARNRAVALRRSRLPILSLRRLRGAERLTREAARY